MVAQFKEKFPTNYSILVVGPPGVGKFEYLLQLARDFLSSGERVVFVTVDLHPREIRERGAEMGLKLESFEGKSFLFVDCFTPSISENPASAVGGPALIVSSFSNLEGIGLAITKAAKDLKPPVRVLFYTISTLFLHNPTQTLAKFFQIVSSRVRTELGFILYAAHEGVHDEKTMRLLQSLVDGVLEMRFGEDMKKEIRIHHMRGMRVESAWTPFVEEMGPLADRVAPLEVAATVSSTTNRGDLRAEGYR